MRVRAVSIVVLLSVAAVISGAPQDKSAVAKKKPASAQLVPFDQTMQRLPPGFTGTNIRAAISRYSLAPKGEFEKTEEYERRAGGFPELVVAFVLPLDAYKAKFYADDGAFSISMDCVPVTVGHDNSRRGFAFISNLKGLRKYPASNAFGAKIQVTESVVEEWSLIVNSYVCNSDVRIPVGGKDPRLMKSRLRLLLVATLSSTSALERLNAQGVTGFTRIDATFNQPHDISVAHHSVCPDVSEIWAFDSVTGEIWGRYNQDGRPLGQIPE